MQGSVVHPDRGRVRRKALNGYKQRRVKQRRQSKRQSSLQMQMD